MIALFKMFQRDATEALAVLDITEDESKAISEKIMAEMTSDDDE